MTKETKTLDQIVEDEKKNFARDTFKTILKNWGVNFTQMSLADKTKTLSEILELAGIKLAKDPAGGLAIKIIEQRRRDTDTQERIRYAQSWNLAVALMSGCVSVADESNALKSNIEFWEEYFYKKLGENGDENG